MKDLKSLLDNFQLDKQKLILILVAVIIFIYVDFSFIMRRQIASIKGLSGKIIKLKNEINNFNRESQRMVQLKQKQGSELSNKPKKKIIPEGEIAVLLGEISNLANQDNVKIIQMSPTKVPGAKPLEGGLIPEAIGLELICSYHSLGAFINHLENMDKFISVEALKIERFGSDIVNESVILELRTYVGS